MAGFSLIALLAIGFVGATVLRTHASAPASVLYRDLPAWSYSKNEFTLQGYVAANDLNSERRHSWLLWAGLNSPSGTVKGGAVLPTWQTWYTTEQVYAGPGKGKRHAFVCCAFEEPRQLIEEHSAIGHDKPAAIMSFVRFNYPAMAFIYQNTYDKQSTLKGLNAFYDAQHRPARMREIKPFPREAVAIKTTFWLIKNPQNGAAITPMPYWIASDPPPSGGRTPNHLTWRHCVAVDPAHRYPEGTPLQVNCNGKQVTAKTIGMQHFYSYRLTDPGEVEAAKEYAKHLSMETDQEHVVTGQLSPEVGDYLVLTAMHVTTKEIPSWTFQTFWWTPYPNAPPFGADRAPQVRGVFANYAMCNAWNEDLPATATGGPHICFNPYLEADLGPTKAYVMDGKRYPADPMAGTRSNCMACHARAGAPAKMDPPYLPGTTSMGHVFNAGHVSRSDPYYAHIITTDFLWSIPLMAR